MTLLPRAGRALIGRASQSYQRNARLGESSAEGEQRIAKPFRLNENYEAKTVLYEAFENPKKLNLAEKLIAVRAKQAMVDYLKANTFHYKRGFLRTLHLTILRCFAE